MATVVYLHKKGKRLKTLLFILLFASTLFSADAKDAAFMLGAEDNYKSALEKAKNENKVLVMVIVKEHCRWCDRLVKRTLSDEKVKKPLEDFVMLVVDKDDSYPNQFKEELFPSIFYVDPVSERSVYSNVGFVGTKCFLNDLNTSLSAYDTLFKKK